MSFVSWIFWTLITLSVHVTNIGFRLDLTSDLIAWKQTIESHVASGTQVCTAPGTAALRLKIFLVERCRQSSEYSEYLYAPYSLFNIVAKPPTTTSSELYPGVQHLIVHYRQFRQAAYPHFSIAASLHVGVPTLRAPIFYL
ncbi:hypothetical protein B0H13DRAFT_277821 [Mycena leptocephala]|jgi:hypothetical protein|nr:hypothetical protein B0H13DRAFT_277821 [Mycena leptocephala]